MGEKIHWGGFFRWSLKEGTLQFEKKRDPTPDERASFQLRKRREEGLAMRALAASFAPIFIGAASFWGLHEAGVSDTGSVVGAVMTWLTGTGLGAWWASRATPKARLRYGITLEEMRAVFPLLTLSRAERVYCDALLMLARVEVDASTEQTLRQTLAQLNELVTSNRLIENKRQSLLPILGLHSIPDLETEFGELGRRLDAATDPLTRQSLQQSLQMCSSRLENARNLHQSLERLNVQQEAILQTLASALSGMARLQVASAPQVELAAQEISNAVSQMNQQTYAVEKAVEEVMTLRVP
jgi:methyl-accepting chemotaxis protein